MNAPWLTVVGIGADGLEGLSPTARQPVEQARVLVGGERHLAMVPDKGQTRIAWGTSLGETIDRLETFGGQAVCVLATGDPFDYGVATALARRFGPDEMTVIPAPGAFSLACARLHWSRPDVESLTLHGRPLALLDGYLRPGARLLILSNDGATPAALARHLRERGFGPSPMTVLARMGAADESRRDGSAETWPDDPSENLNTIAVTCVAGPGARVLPRVPGLPDAAFEHDGQITKREVRAVTIAALGPLPGEALWDVGAGSGSVAIEWMRAERNAAAIAVERNPERCARIARNAASIGVPGLRVVEGQAPEVLATLDGTPDAVFVGGGARSDKLLDACWSALRPGGRMVVNVVSLDGRAGLAAMRDVRGGELLEIAISRSDSLGGAMVLRPALPVLQYRGVKP